jgi:glycosyltransferase involved in cell wall biosynthesis
MDNHGTDETRNVVERIGSDKVHHFRAPARLSMSDNWELALSHARGDYVTFVGDDDALFHDTIETATWFHQRYEGEILAWKPVVWYWPKVVVPEYRNLLSYHLSSRVEIRGSPAALRSLYAGEYEYFTDLPSIYNAFVPRGVISKAVDKYGRYFLSEIPDVASAITNACFSERYLYSFRPLALAGASHHSTGMSQAFRHHSRSSVARFEEENTWSWDSSLDPSLDVGMSETAEVAIANVLLKLKTVLFPSNRDIQFSFDGLIRQMCTRMNRYSANYDEVMTLIGAIAAKHDIPANRYEIPARESLNLAITPYAFEQDGLWMQGEFTDPDSCPDVEHAAKHMRGKLSEREDLVFISCL